MDLLLEFGFALGERSQLGHGGFPPGFPRDAVKHIYPMLGQHCSAWFLVSEVHQPAGNVQTLRRQSGGRTAQQMFPQIAQGQQQMLFILPRLLRIILRKPEQVVRLAFDAEQWVNEPQRCVLPNDPDGIGPKILIT